MHCIFYSIVLIYIQGSFFSEEEKIYKHKLSNFNKLYKTKGDCIRIGINGKHTFSLAQSQNNQNCSSPNISVW